MIPSWTAGSGLFWRQFSPCVSPEKTRLTVQELAIVLYMQDFFVLALPVQMSYHEVVNT